MDKITITGMEFYGYHGVLSEENKLGQRFIVDLELFLDLHQAGKNDDLTASVNYAEVYAIIKELVENREQPFQTIEALAEHIALVIKQQFEQIHRLNITVHKPGAPVPGIFKDIAVTLER